MIDKPLDNEPRLHARPETQVGAHLGGEGRGTFVIDPRCVHLFEYEARSFAYFVESGAVMEVDSIFGRLIALARSGDESYVNKEMAHEVDSWRPSDLDEVLGGLREGGHIDYVPYDKPNQERMIERLWRHRPRRLQLLVSQICNLKCVYCYEEFNGSNARKRLMSEGVAFQAIDYLVRKSGSRSDLQLTFFGGEPLLNWDLIVSCVRYCRTIESESDKVFKFEVISNGVLLDDDKVDFLIENEFLLMLSLDGYREMHEANRPSVSGRDTFDRVMRNVRRAVERYRASGLGLPVKVRANLTEEYHDVVKVVRFFEALGITSIGVAAIEALPWQNGEEHACNGAAKQAVKAAHEKLLEIAISKAQSGGQCTPYESRLLRKALGHVRSTKHTRGLSCGVGRNTNIVDTDGVIYPCHRYGNMGAYSLGSIYNMELDEGKVRAYYDKVNEASSGKCQDCWARNVCAGPCAWTVSKPNGEVLEPSEESCVEVREALEKSLKLRVRLEEEAPWMVNEFLSEQGTCGC